MATGTASRVGYEPEAQGGMPPGPQILYVLATRTSHGRTIHTTRTVGPQATSLHRNLTRRASGPGAIPCWKLFAPYLPTLVAVPRLIFIDSDLLLLESPRALWARVHPNPNPGPTPTPNPNPSSTPTP